MEEGEQNPGPGSDLTASVAETSPFMLGLRESKMQVLILSVFFRLPLLFQFPWVVGLIARLYPEFILMLLFSDGCKQSYLQRVKQPLSKSGYLLYYFIHTG